RELSAPQIFINTGARPKAPDWPGVTGLPYLTNTSMMELDTLPSHLVIAGASYVGLEFAHMYARFGSKVTLIERGPRAASREDEDISEAIRGILEPEGVSFLFNTTIEAAARAGNGTLLSLKTGERRASVEGSHLLVAVGRLPNVEDLDLAAAGVELNARGYIETDEQLRTNVPGIWALGDVNGRGAFTHTSYDDYAIVADNVLNGAARSVEHRIPV